MSESKPLQSNENEYKPEQWPCVESPKFNRARKISHYVMYFTISSSSLYYSVLLVSLWPYLNQLDPSADKQFLGYLAAIGAFGTTIFCPIFGRWSNSLKSCRMPFLFTLFCGAMQYVIYVSLSLIQVEHRRYWFLLSRFLVGLHDINIGLTRGYIAESTLKSERRQAISIITGCQTVAFALGPSMQSLMVPLSETGYSFFNGYIVINMYTSIGWLALITILINSLLFLPCVFQHCDMRHAEKSISQSNNNRHYKLIAWLFILLQFWLICNYLYLKVLGTPIVMDEFAMNRPDALQYNSHTLTAGAIVSLLAILTLDFCCKRLGEMNVMYLGFVIMILGRIVMFPIGDEKVTSAMTQNDLLGCPQWSQSWCIEELQMSKTQFILSNVLDNFGYSWAITIIYTKFSQVLGAKQQGTWMGFMTSFSGLARILSPVVLSYLYVGLGNRSAVIVTSLVYVFLLLITLWLIKYLTKKGEVVDFDQNDQNNHNSKELIEIPLKICDNDNSMK